MSAEPNAAASAEANAATGAQGSAAPSRPMPEWLGPDAGEFYEGTRHREFRVPRCPDCRRVVWYPRAHCPYCGALELTWETLPDPVGGTVYTFTVVRRHAHPFFAARVPYVVAWVDIDDGPRVLTEVACADVDALRVGDRVVLDWEPQEAFNLHTFVRVPS
ncbi:OB-fold domain-containing protein [Solwaraspora sp. WMMD1047]|uniref:Zn-ribbon domain-containing OB-fold protein n=1 Tax=Solwaraspora sp. WMMD1047 TaxID=3016102 RepID=UPI002415D274|nr:OB-fold domain-containing protein [Solwaraspora sp. WMMD1047]MDG4834351.1 OB-fold domain-containing protein [Solwaraspora sp. WMMD1047]